MRNIVVLVSGLLIGVIIGGGVVYWWAQNQTDSTQTGLPNPLSKFQEPERPLLAYTIEALHQRKPEVSALVLGEELERKPEFTAYQFTYQTTGATMSGRITFPADIDQASAPAVLVMVRGFVPNEGYVSGAGTNPAARYFATNGFVTVAPDFLGYGKSDPEISDEWQARFQKPLQVSELIESLKTNGIPLPNQNSALSTLPVNSNRLGLWAHSNGGQIVLTALEIMGKPIPTTLWAPVTAPFPYSILYFGDEETDEGKQQRAWIAQFEKLYNVGDFSFTQHLNLLQGPLQIHQGLQDEAFHYTWSQEFVDKVKAENSRRQAIVVELSQTPTPTSTNTSAAITQTPTVTPTPITTPLTPIEITFYTYPGTDHNMRPSWDTVIQRDVEFFQKQLNVN